MTSTFDLFRQAKDFKYTIPQVVGKNESKPAEQPKKFLDDYLQDKLSLCTKAFGIGNKYQAMQHLSDFIGALSEATANHDFETEEVLAKSEVIQQLESEQFIIVVDEEIKRTLDSSTIFGGNIKAFTEIDSLCSVLMQDEHVFNIIYSANSADSIFELLQCAGTYLRLKNFARFQAFEKDVLPGYLELMDKIQEIGIENAHKRYGDNFMSFAIGLARQLKGEECAPADGHQIASAILNSVSPMLSKAVIRDYEFIQDVENIQPTDIYLDLIKEDDPSVVFLINPLTDSTLLGDLPLKVPHVIGKLTKPMTMSLIMKPLLPTFDN